MTPEQQKIIEQDAKAKFPYHEIGAVPCGVDYEILDAINDMRNGYIDGATAVISNPGRYGVGGVWVKASERLPNLEKREERKYVCIKAEGLYFSAFFEKDKKHFVIKSQPSIIYRPEQYNLHWLDESSPCAPDVSELVSALEKIARQETSNECERYEDGEPMGDFLNGYDKIIEIARQALKQFNP